MRVKYSLTPLTAVRDGVTVYRIRAERNVGGNRARAGDLGGWVSSEANLSHSGSAWIGPDAWVTGAAVVDGDAYVSGEACVSGRARITGKARVRGQASVTGDAAISGGSVNGHARVSGHARIEGGSVHDRAHVHGNAVCVRGASVGMSGVVSGSAVIGEAFVCGTAEVSGSAQVGIRPTGDTSVYYPPTTVGDAAVVTDRAVVGMCCEIVGQARVDGDAVVGSYVHVGAAAHVGGSAHLVGQVRILSGQYLGTSSTATPSEPGGIAPRHSEESFVIRGVVLTSQQRQIVDGVKTGGDVLVSAGAGTGKTTTLRELARAMTTRGVYVAFNESTAQFARRTFPPSTVCRTAHSFAWKAVAQSRNGAAILGRVDVPVSWFETAEFLDLTKPVVYGNGPARRMLNVQRLTFLALDTVSQFCRSDHRHISVADVPRVDALGAEEYADLASLVAAKAQLAWDEMTSGQGSKCPVRHDIYLKLWQLSDPRLAGDVLFFDEAQDANPAIAAVIYSQPHQKIYVGDPNQAIYGFNGAIDAMATFDAAHRVHLTESFRFGEPIARAANSILRLLDSPFMLQGRSDVESRVAPDLSTPHAILCRTNKQAVSELTAALNAGRKVHFLGGGELTALTDGAAQLIDTGATEHPQLASYASWQEAREWALAGGGSDLLKTLVPLVEEHGIEELNCILRLCEPIEGDADLVIATAHKAKGREWDSVRLAPDFADFVGRARESLDPNNPSDQARDELRLLYVAATRAKHGLALGPVQSLLAGGPIHYDGTAGKELDPRSRSRRGTELTLTITLSPSEINDIVSRITLEQLEEISRAHEMEFGSPLTLEDVRCMFLEGERTHRVSGDSIAQSSEDGNKPVRVNQCDSKPRRFGHQSRLLDRGVSSGILSAMTAETVPCEMGECQDEATHTVRIQFAAQPEEIWQVCRPHDSQLKTAAVRSRPKAQPPVEQPPAFRCADCDQVLQDSTPPCPVCGSLDRVISTGDRVTAHENTVVYTRRPGKGQWLAKIKAGDDYTRDLEAWGSRELIIDRERDSYREVIELYEGSRIESSARLSDHQG